jgi:hypothetical protein
LKLFLDLETTYSRHPDINHRDSHRMALAYARNPSGSLNNCASNPPDKSKRWIALSIEGSSSSTQIVASTLGHESSHYQG